MNVSLHYHHPLDGWIMKYPAKCFISWWVMNPRKIVGRSKIGLNACFVLLYYTCTFIYDFPVPTLRAFLLISLTFFQRLVLILLEFFLTFCLTAAAVRTLLRWHILKPVRQSDRHLREQSDMFLLKESCLQKISRCAVDSCICMSLHLGKVNLLEPPSPLCRL